MKIDFDATLNDLSGQPMKMTDAADSSVATLKVICTDVLIDGRDEPGLSADLKVKRFKLALAIHMGGVQEISPEDVVSLRGLIGKRYGPMVVGRAYELLDAPVAP